MIEQVAIIGVGYSGYRSLTPDLSYKEMMFEAAVRAYQEAGIDPRADVDGFVTVAEDYNEGTSIFDEYVPDQLGGVLKPVHTIGGDGIHGLIAAYMQILTGAMDIVVVEGHSKASNILTKPEIMAFAMDPVFNRPLAAHPYFIAGMEMQRYLFETGTTPLQCAQVVVKNKANALQNPIAAHPANISPEEVLFSAPVAEPLTQLEIAPHADGAIVMVLASEKTARALSDAPIWIRGVGWCNDTFWLESRSWSEAWYARLAGQMAYRMAGLRSPRYDLDLAEVDDTFAYKELQHMEALGLCQPGEAGILTEEGATEITGDLPINPSGGSLGCGHLLDASGLARVLEVVWQLRGQAGPRQVEDAELALAFGWRGLPTTSGAAIVLSN
ncbi:MAG: acetyl-CoA acetyltransferase [Chloroflexi bacterium]|nr:acetyl-CoA acetyltransferase [Chloroflexota bacterium]